jgi:hypothetical protein
MAFCASIKAQFKEDKTRDARNESHALLIGSVCQIRTNKWAMVTLDNGGAPCSRS